MRLVLDTNTVVSAAFWFGPPHQLVELAEAGHCQVFSSPDLIVELEEVLGREKFKVHLRTIGRSADDVVLGYLSFASVVKPDPIEPTIAEDPDDDAVLACAVTARASSIVSGDQHLLALKVFRGIEIVTAAALLDRLSRQV